jgi:hypothetical protein
MMRKISKRTRLRDIKKAIGWENNCKVYFTRNGIKYGYYNPNKGIDFTGRYAPYIHIPRHRKYYRNCLNHVFLHECLHYLIEQKFDYKYIRKTLYIREYRVEKQVRKYARLYGWKDILNISNRWVKNNLFLEKRKFFDYNKPYIYAARRIAREEKIGGRNGR